MNGGDKKKSGAITIHNQDTEDFMLAEEYKEIESLTIHFEDSWTFEDVTESQRMN